MSKHSFYFHWAGRQPRDQKGIGLGNGRLTMCNIFENPDLLSNPAKVGGSPVKVVNGHGRGATG